MTEILQTPKLVVVFGGSGFVGRHVVRALAKRGYRIRVACRRPDLAGHLQPLGNVGQIQPVQANVRVRWSVERPRAAPGGEGERVGGGGARRPRPIQDGGH
ncbi:NAD-dependent epimerase/dehydratase family protein, partial [Mesorhizobium sp. M1088]|uniref:NAD-dependent epimerase/dehydratase family protein n=1 Tax=Mesorhizobium sp. M1088 TaxID=2957056 RepID=UPI003338414C